MKYFWMGDFSKSILQRGKDYFFKGLVHNLKIESNEYAKATVFGSDSYFVTVRKTKNGLFRYNCDCPYGLNCKHEAAVCYALEENDFFDNQDESSASIISGEELKKNISEKEVMLNTIRLFQKTYMERRTPDDKIYNKKRKGFCADTKQYSDKS